MKVLMICPRYPVTFWSFKYVLKYISKKAAYPPLGLLTVAAMLPEEWKVKLVDVNVEKLRDGDLAWADLVMIGAMLIQRESADDILQRCRRAGKTIVAGGPLFTALADEYADRADHLVLGEAESTLPPFLADLRAGSPRRRYESLEFPSLSLTPPPRWDLIDVEKYATLMVQYSRGCPFDCEFCDVTSLFGRVPRVKSPDQFLGELQKIYDLGWRGSLFIVDDNFIGHKRSLQELLARLTPWMKERLYPFEFLTEVSINLAEDDELTRMMVDAGFNGVFVGLETPDEDSLKECAKFQNCRIDLVEAIRKLQRAGLQVSGGYIVGFDSDDEGIFARQTKFIQETGVVTAMIGLLNALPNTRLWHRLKSQNRLADCSSGDNTDGSINFIPRMDRSKLIQGYQSLLLNLYSPPQYYRRIMNFLQEYRPARAARFDRRRFKAFLKSIFFLGIMGFGKTQWYYWKLFFGALIRHRESLPLAMTMMVYGHHFRKLARKIARKAASGIESPAKFSLPTP